MAIAKKMTEFNNNNINQPPPLQVGIGDEILPKKKQHIQINPKPTLTTTLNFNTTNSTSTTTSSSSQEEEKEVIAHLDCNIGSKLLINFYSINSKFKLKSNIIINNTMYLSNEIIYHTNHNIQSIQSPPQLLYRGSRDGFEYEDFHSRCDNQGPTLTLIKSSEPYNQIFGGFTTQSWKTISSYRQNVFHSDDSAFIFKIDEKNQLFRKFNVKQDRKQHAMYNYINCLPIFGGDIWIFSDCNLDNRSRSQFGHTYELPTYYSFSGETANSYLAGSEYFQVSEIEVFKIII